MGQRVRMAPEVHQREMSPELDSVPPQPREISTTGQQPRIGATRQYSLPGREQGRPRGRVLRRSDRRIISVLGAIQLTGLR